MAIISKHRDGGYWRYTITKSTIKYKGRKREVCWIIDRNRGKKQLYIVCPDCRKISHISLVDLKYLRNSYTENPYLGCIICPNCTRHNFYTLHGLNKKKTKKKRVRR